MYKEITHASASMKQALTPHFPIPPKPILSENDSVFLMGSCFSDAMLSRFQQRNVHATANPFGTIYHPKPLLLELETIAQLSHSQKLDKIQIQTNGNIPNPDSLFQYQDRFHSLQHAHRFSSNNAETLLNTLQQTRTTAAQEFSTATTIVLTLGTAWYYQHLPTLTTVGNCHKLPGQQFEKHPSSTQEILSLLQQFFNTLTPLFPHKNWILTVSPVRHIRDGIQENLRSKSTLICAINDFIQQSPSNHIHYFPAYEIMREELNDWRFFKEDLMHPTPWAEDYIFQRFAETYYPESAQSALSDNLKRWKQSQHY